MDFCEQDCAKCDAGQRWIEHFTKLAAIAAEMFSLVADAKARIEERFLEHPDDRIFTWLLTGYAKSMTPRADELLNRYLRDDEAWVRELSRAVLETYFSPKSAFLRMQANRGAEMLS
jgi:hypothetical protein